MFHSKAESISCGFVYVVTGVIMLVCVNLHTEIKLLAGSSLWWPGNTLFEKRSFVHQQTIQFTIPNCLQHSGLVKNPILE